MALDVDDALEWAAGHSPGVLITLKKDGSPQSSDVAFIVDAGEIVVSLTDDRAKTHNMRRDPRIVLHVTVPGEWSYVSFSGEADLGPVTTDPHDAAADALVSYYEDAAGSPHPDWEEYRAAMVDEKRLLLRLRPTRAVGQIR